MIPSPSLPVQVVERQAELDLVAADIGRQRRIALDIESNSFHRYPERVCLVQVATESHVWIIDPLAAPDFSSIGRALAEPGIEKVLHSADYDVRSLDREWGFRINNLFDTAVAAHFIGATRLGLAGILEEFAGKVLPKEKRLQRSDWTLRPLTEEALAYAAGDVESLLSLRELLGQRLAALGRAEWVDEECARLAEARYSPPDADTAFLGMKGASAMGPRGLAVLRELVRFREAQARQIGRPPFRVLPDSALLYLAANSRADLAEVPGLSQHARHRFGPGIRHALREGRCALPVHRPRLPRCGITPEEIERRRERLKALKGWRQEAGEHLGMDPPLLWPTASLERIAAAPETLRQEVDAPEVRRWQRTNVAQSLLAQFGSWAAVG